VKRLKTIGLGAIGGVFAATGASAHVQIAGLSDFNAGVLHPLLTLQHALALIAFGLMCGQFGAALLRFGLPSLAIGLALGFATAEMGAAADVLPKALTALALLAGLAVAANYRPPGWACIFIAAAIGTMIGLDSKPEAATLMGEAAGIAGTSIGALLLFLNLAGLAAFATAQWQSIGIRVIGSWTSAAAFLNIALLFRK
jgi:hydrogenase/urease accessory protein HupE